MHIHISFRSTVGALLALPFLAACGGSSGSGAVPPPPGTCGSAGANEIATAVGAYIKTVSPTPLRYLVAASGDSALPDTAQQTLQAKGPMYLYPSDPALQKKMLSELQEKGPGATLLVLYLGSAAGPKSTATIKIGGQFVGEDSKGDTAPTTSFEFKCQKGIWALTSPGAKGT